jgi:hypothetical protein
MKLKALMLGLCTLLSGCILFSMSDKSLYEFSKSVGKAVKIASNLSTVAKDDLVAVMEFIDNLKLPEIGVDNYSTVVVDYINLEVDRYIESKEMTETQKEIVRNSAKLLIKGIDYVYTKFPKLKYNMDKSILVFGGLLDGMKSSDSDTLGVDPVMLEAYDYITQSES